MTRGHELLGTLLLLALTGPLACTHSSGGQLEGAKSGDSRTPEGFIHAEGAQLVDDAGPIYQGDPTQKLPEEADAIPGLREVFADRLR